MNKIQVGTRNEFKNLKVAQLNKLIELTESEGFAVLLDVIKNEIDTLKEQTVNFTPTENSNTDFHRMGFVKGKYQSYLFILLLNKLLGVEMQAREKIDKIKKSR